MLYIQRKYSRLCSHCQGVIIIKKIKTFQVSITNSHYLVHHFKITQKCIRCCCNSLFTLYFLFIRTKTVTEFRQWLTIPNDTQFCFSQSPNMTPWLTSSIKINHLVLFVHHWWYIQVSTCSLAMGERVSENIWILVSKFIHLILSPNLIVLHWQVESIGLEIRPGSVTSKYKCDLFSERQIKVP